MTAAPTGADVLALIGPGRFIDPAVIQEAAKAGTHRYPYAVWTPLPETTTQPLKDMNTFILHSMAGPSLTSLEAITRYYTRTDITGEPTFALDMVGRACQYMHTNQRADNNYKANEYAVSIETQDQGAATLPTTPWTAPQVAQLAGMAAFLHIAEGVPIRRSATPSGGGIDGHRAHAEWSKYVGKTCPGDARWDQIPAILELAQSIVDWRPAPPTPPEEDDMATPTLFLAKHINGKGEVELWRGDGLRSERCSPRVTTDLLARDILHPKMSKFRHPFTGQPFKDWDDVPTISASQIHTDLGTPG